MHYQPLRGLREQLFCFAVQRPCIVSTKLRPPAIQDAKLMGPLTSLVLGARSFL